MTTPAPTQTPPPPTPPPPPPPPPPPLPLSLSKETPPDSDLTSANDGTSRESRAAEGDATVEAEGGVEKKAEEGDRLMDGGDAPTPALATVFRIRLKQPPCSLRHKMNVPDLCRNFSAVAWCGKLNAIACASETCARIPSSTTNPPFWIPIHIVNPERPTECAIFNVKADSPCDSVQFIEWSPRSCRRALLVGNFQGRITI